MIVLYKCGNDEKERGANDENEGGGGGASAMFTPFCDVCFEVCV